MRAGYWTKSALTLEIAANKTTPDNDLTATAATRLAAATASSQSRQRKATLPENREPAPLVWMKRRQMATGRECLGESFLNGFPRSGWLNVTHKQKSNHLGKTKSTCRYSLIVVGKAEVIALDALDERASAVSGMSCCRIVQLHTLLLSQPSPPAHFTPFHSAKAMSLQLHHTPAKQSFQDFPSWSEILSPARKQHERVMETEDNRDD